MASPPRKLAKKWYIQSFKEEWLHEKEFKEWLQEDSKERGVSYCACCKTQIKNANRSMLMAHCKTAKHLNNMKEAKVTTKIDLFIKKQLPKESDEVAKAELLISAYIAEHNVPFAHADHLVEVCKRAFHDSSIAKNVKLHATKASYLIQEGIAYYEKREIVDQCRNEKFSLIIDESTDISVSQVLAVVVRYFDVEKNDVCDSLLDSIVVEDGSASGLYKAVKTTLNEKKIPVSNIIGFGSDNCSTMMGSKSGFQTLLKKDIPSVFVMGCVCHSFALCASHAVKMLPPYLESFLKNITFYFSRSSKRNRDFTLIQEVTKTETHKIPKLAQTRWLSRGNVIKIILEQWDALLLYFQSESKEDKVDGANNIYQTFKNRGTKHMLLFLNYVLEKVDRLNIEFQSENFRLHVLHSMVYSEYKNILSSFIREEVVQSTRASDIDPSDKSLHKQLNDLYLGGRCMRELSLLPIGENDVRFKMDCLNFLVALCLQIKKRFPLEEDGIVANLQILDPAASRDITKSPSSIVNVAQNFPHLVPEDVLDKLDDEWRLFRQFSDVSLTYTSVPGFWHSLRNIKDGINQPKFGTLSSFMTNLTILPHSSACVERIFSLVNHVKTKQTNLLKTETVTDRLLARQFLARKQQNCYTWNPKQELVKDVADGTCYQRYEQRLEQKKRENINLAAAEDL